MLLNDIITIAEDNNESLSRLLRKCIVLAHQINSELLGNWADQELNGYTESQELPAYRIVQVDAGKILPGPFGSGSTHWPLPSISINENHRQVEKEICLSEAVSVYQTLIEEAETMKGRRPRFESPGEIFTYYRRKLAPSQRGMVLVGATQEVPTTALIEILDNVRTCTLNIALEIKGELGDKDEDLLRATPDRAARIEQKILNIIRGETNVRASGNPE